VGLSLSWVAVRGLKPEQALAALGMQVSHVVRYEDIGWRRNVVLGPLPGDWLLVASAGAGQAFKGKLQPLTKLGPAVAGEILDMVSESEVRGYADGSETWRVAHDPSDDEGVFSIEISGDPPPQLGTIVREARAEQDAEGGEEAGVDYMIDVPGQLAHSICGYHPGEHEPHGVDFSELRPTKSATGGFFARLLGRV